MVVWQVRLFMEEEEEEAFLTAREAMFIAMLIILGLLAVVVVVFSIVLVVMEMVNRPEGAEGFILAQEEMVYSVIRRVVFLPLIIQLQEAQAAVDFTVVMEGRPIKDVIALYLDLLLAAAEAVAAATILVWVEPGYVFSVTLLV